MKLFFIITYFCICLQLPAQEVFTKNRWSTNAIIGVKDFRFSDKATDIVLDTLNRTYPYGYITEFMPDSTFLSYNIGWCGNECNVITKGTYRITASIIELFVISVGYFGDCKNMPSQELNSLLGMYQWEQKDTRLILTPAKNN